MSDLNNTMPHITHLVVHSQYTLLGAIGSPEELAAQAAAEGLQCLALTDTNALYGAVRFSQACQARGIQPIIGMVATVAMPPDLVRPIPAAHVPGEIVLMATGADGYRSLARLSSTIQGHPDRLHRARSGLSLDDLRSNCEGLTCLTGGRRGWIWRYIRSGDCSTPHRFAGRLAGVFGTDNTYLALDIQSQNDANIAQEVASLGAKLGLPTIATYPIHCIVQADQQRLRTLAAIRDTRTLAQVSPWDLPTIGDPSVSVHWKPVQQISQQFRDFPEAVEAIAEVAQRCESPLTLGGSAIWPAVDLRKEQNPDQALCRLAEHGAAKQYSGEVLVAALERLGIELAAITHHGYAPLFLVVADMVMFARANGIPISTRGSVANSLVAFCSGITDVDPIAHGLLFERFLSPSRADAPDIDIDVCSRRREEVLDYVRQKYGFDHVALVATFSTFRLRSAVREVSKVYGLDDEQTRRLVALLPHRSHRPASIFSGRNSKGIDMEHLETRQKQILEEATQLVGQPRHLGIHAGGLVITPTPLTDFVPVQWATKGCLTTQYDFRDLEQVGLPKIDLLGIRALTVLATASDSVRQWYAPEFEIARIPEDDVETQTLIESGSTVGVFQCESAGARSTLRKLRARSIRDLAVANAFFKPGPSTGGMAGAFVRRFHGEEETEYLHPSLEPILSPTKGVLIFQEQILRVAHEIAGLSWAQADHLRRGISKWKPAEMLALKGEFIGGCTREPPEGPGMSQNQAETLWQQIYAFSGYGFNQGHATAYAMVSYRSAFVKAHWPAAFLCARLAEWGGFHHPALYMAETITLGISVRAPHINHSHSQFTMTTDTHNATLWMGLDNIRDVRQSTIGHIIDSRNQHRFTSLRHLLARVPMQQREIAGLIKTGALDGMGESRASMLMEMDLIIQSAAPLQMAFPFAVSNAAPEINPLARNVAWERQLLGYPMSILKCPLRLVSDGLRDSLRVCIPLQDLGNHTGRQVRIAGVRLPGWTGTTGFHFWDGSTWILVKQNGTLSNPAVWMPTVLNGRWLSDRWGNGWFQAEHAEQLPSEYDSESGGAGQESINKSR